MAAFTSFVLRRRSQRKQKVIRIIRGSMGDSEARSEAMAEITAAGGDGQSQVSIAGLCALLARAAIDIRRAGCAWLSADDLHVLAWLAYAHRDAAIPDYPMFGRRIDANIVAELRAKLATCGHELVKMGCRLPALAWTSDIERPLHARSRR